MSKYHGMLLFDIADEPIGKWQENLGTRGYYDEWELIDKDKIKCTLIIEADEDGKVGDNEVWIHDKEGNSDSLYFGTYDQCLKYAKKWMKENQK
jgi:hypothetical protein